jgi:hypothetical protein
MTYFEQAYASLDQGQIHNWTSTMMQLAFFLQNRHQVLCV